jgi:HD-GYP domain-containing protein (c-di-GMP phosphodiesterase class II)
MFRLLQVVKIHQSNNKLFSENVQHFKGVLEDLWQNNSTAHFALYRGRFYLNDERIVYTPTMWATSAKLAEYFQDRGIVGISFTDKGPLTQDGIVGFMDVFNRATKAENPSQWLSDSINENFPWVAVFKDDDKDMVADGRVQGDAEAGRSVIVHGTFKETTGIVAKRAYSQALTALRTMVQRLEDGKSAGIQKSKRVVQQLIDLLFEDEASCLCLSTIRDLGDQVYTHSVNVAIMALCVGRRLGLSRSSLEQLGLAGFFFDLGKAGPLAEITQRPGRLRPEDQERLKGHPLLSVLSIIRLNASHGLKHSILAAAGEHHMGLDHSGYPRLQLGGRALSLYGRILAVADQYDALTSDRPWREALSPHDALVRLMSEAGTKLDPAVLKAFVGLMGSFPPGSVMILDTHEVALAWHTPSPLVGAPPLARLLIQDEEGALSPGPMVDLSETDPATGRPLRSILASIHPSKLGVQPVDYLLPDEWEQAPSRQRAV